MAANKKKYILLWRILFVAYLILLFYFLFFSEGLGRMNAEGDYRYNITLFKEIRRYITYRKTLGTEIVFLNLAGNVLAFMPFGFCWPLLWNYRMNWFVTTMSAFSLSVLAEIVQLVCRLGSFDVDDILLNTIGGFLGCLVCMIINREKRKGTKKKS